MLLQVADTICLFKAYLEQSNSDSYHQNNIVSDFQTTHICFTGSKTLHCCISTGKQKFPLILVQQNSSFSRIHSQLYPFALCSFILFVAKETWHMRKQCVLSYLLPRKRAWEKNEARYLHAGSPWNLKLKHSNDFVFTANIVCVSSVCFIFSGNYEDTITSARIAILVAVVIGIPPLSLVAGSVLSLLNG